GGAVVEDDLDLDGGVAARVQDLARADSLDGRHSISLIGWSGDGRGERCATRGSLARVGGLLRADLGAETAYGGAQRLLGVDTGLPGPHDGRQELLPHGHLRVPLVRYSPT